MASFIIALVTGVAAGALTARTIVRQELDRYAREAAERAKAAPPPPPVAPVPPTPVAVVAPPPPPPAPVVAPPPPAPEELEVTPEILMVLTAAVAAFLGKRARIKQVRSAPRYGGSAWAQQGRVFVQASHNLARH